MRARTDSQLMVGRGDLQLLEEQVRELAIVVLPGVDKDLFTDRPQVPRHGGCLDVLRPVSDHGEDPHAPILAMQLVLSCRGSASLRSAPFMSAVLRVVHMGDSITEGQGVDPSVRWTSIIERNLKSEFGADAIKSINSGISGETTRMGLERYPRDVQELNPDLFTLQFGMNDCNCWETDRGVPRVSEAAFRANLIEMILRARHFGARHVILATNPCSLRTSVVLPSGAIYEDRNARYSDIVREVAIETEVELCDIREAFAAVGEDALRNLLDPDLLHLSVAGNEFYAETIWPLISRAAAPLIDLSTHRV
jgi:lysophospholipase L1-like esterase